MKRKQVINKQHQQDGDDSSDCTYDAEEETTQQQQRHHKKMRAVKREHSSSDSDDSDAATSWSSPNLLTAKDLPLRAMKQSVVQWIRQTYSVAAHGWTAKADIFEDYLSEWARMGKEPQLTAPAFGRLVHKAFPGIKSCRMGPRIRARHCYKGLVRREGLDSSASSPAHSPISSSVVSSPSVESSTTTTTTATSSPYSTSAASSPQQQPHDYNHHHDGHQQWAQHNMEQVLIDLESELETEMLSMGNIKQEPLTDDTEEVTEAYGVPQYYPPQPQPQHYYPAEQNQGTTYYSAPDADAGCTSSSSPSPTVASPYEWSTFPPTATTPAGMPFFTSLPAYTSSVSVPLPPNYYYPAAAATTSLPYHYPYPAWPSYPAASTAVAGGFGVVDNCAAAPFAYTSMPPATSMLYSSEAVPAPQPSSLSLSSSGRSDILLSSFLSFDL